MSRHHGNRDFETDAFVRRRIGTAGEKGVSQEKMRQMVVSKAIGKTDEQIAKQYDVPIEVVRNVCGRGLEIARNQLGSGYDIGNAPRRKYDEQEET